MPPEFIAVAHIPGEIWELESGQRLEGVHRGGSCQGDTCVFHKPTDHHMASWPQIWRYDRHIFERICPHGVGHPDPDQFEFWKLNEVYESEAVHGCDGCCVRVAEDSIP